MKMFPEKKMEETSMNNRTRSGKPPDAKDKIEETPSPGSPGMQILARYPITVKALMKAMEIACV
ncbi:MAG: hypothetical protein ABSE05_14985 [Syntrophales bacterium]